uniref:Uncharacterized protein n=1 Tax=Glossina pallidipes TaxID=7398 RepID=A0A1A9ZSM0_GLOPL
MEGRFEFFLRLRMSLRFTLQLATFIFTVGFMDFHVDARNIYKTKIDLKYAAFLISMTLSLCILLNLYIRSKCGGIFMDAR